MENINGYDLRKVVITVAKMKSYATLWWDNIHKARRREGKLKIKLRSKMLKLQRAIFMLTDYQQKLLKQFQNFSQKE